VKKLLIALMIVVLSGCNPKTQTDPIIDDLDKVTLLEKEDLMRDYIDWYGRHYYMDDTEEVNFHYTATGFKVDFTGSAVNITLNLSHKDNNIYFSLAKDGESLLDCDVIILSESTQTFTVSFDEYTDHTIEIVKRSEPEDGITSLVSVETNGTFNLVEKTEDIPHFLLIGASGISGHGSLGTQGQSRTTANSSSLHSFGYLSAKEFNGSFEFVSSSGWGLLYGFNDKTGAINITSAYESMGIDTSRNIIDVLYNHEVIPNVIIVNIGGNDYSSVINKLSGFDKEDKNQEFKTAVIDFIKILREDAPNAHIFWTMTSGSLNGSAATSVINLLSEEDRSFVHIVVIKGVGDDGTPIGANNHCSYETHQLSAQILVDEILKYTGLVLPQ